jgi:LacI family transcriptional regulator
MVTLKDVAKHAGVSVTSASYALNGTGTISAETRLRILETAERLNYHPNAFARNLKKQKTGIIGVFITRFSGVFYEDILEGIHDAVLQTDYELIVCPESRVVRRLLSQRQVDGAIVFDSKIESKLLQKLASKRFPIVVLDRNLKGDFLFPLLVDNQKGVVEAFYHLYNQGARRLIFISGALDSFDNMERSKAFLLEAFKNHVPVQSYFGNFTETSGYEVAKQLIKNCNFPDAVFCANDQMAIGFIKAMKEHHLRAPQDIAIVGFDNIRVSEYMQPTLSTIGASRFLWGSRAASQLIDFLENEHPFQSDRIPTQFIARESSSKADKLAISNLSPLCTPLQS